MPAADWSFSKDVLTKEGLSEYITEYVIPSHIQAEIDKTEEILLKKRKTVYIETLIVFVLFVIYIIFTMVTRYRRAGQKTGNNYQVRKKEKPPS